MFDKDTNTFVYYGCDHIIRTEDGYYLSYTTNHKTWESAENEGKFWVVRDNEKYDYWTYEKEIEFDD